VPGASPGALTVNGVSPARGNVSTGSLLTFSFSDTNGYQDLGVLNILINDVLDGRQACYIAYSRPLNTLYLVNDAGTGLLPVVPPSVYVRNSQCGVSVQGAGVVPSGNTVNLTLFLDFSKTFAGNQVIYVAARDFAGANSSGWQPVGTWTLQ